MGRLTDNSKRATPPELSSFRLKPDLRLRLESFAAKDGVDLTNVATRALEAFLPPLNASPKKGKVSKTEIKVDPIALYRDFEKAGLTHLINSPKTRDLSDMLRDRRELTILISDFRTWIGLHKHLEALRDRLRTPTLFTKIFVVQESESAEPDADTLSCLEKLLGPRLNPKTPMGKLLALKSQLARGKPREIYLLTNTTTDFYIGLAGTFVFVPRLHQSAQFPFGLVYSGADIAARFEQALLLETVSQNLIEWWELGSRSKRRPSP